MGDAKTCQVIMHDGNPCGRELYDDVHCICHSKNPRKDLDLFHDVLFSKGAQRGAPNDWTEYVFPDRARWYVNPLSRHTYYTRAQFLGDIDVRGLTTEYSVDWTEAVFHGRVNLAGLQCRGPVSFDRTCFEKELNLGGASLAGPVNFSQAIFRKRATFRETRFQSHITFDGAEFRDKVTFHKCQFQGNIQSRLTQYDDRVDWRDAMFHGNASWEFVAFGTSAHFARCVFVRPASFINAVFKGVANFSSAEFQDNVSFGNVDFHHAALFCSTRMADSMVLLQVVAHRGVDFTEARFMGDAGFKGCDFRGETHFDATALNGNMVFQRTSFRAPAHFKRCACESASSLIFDGEESDAMFTHEADFRQLRLADSATVQFRKTKMHKCRFLETDVSRVHFSDVDWPIKGWLARRAYSFDETRSHSSSHDENSPDSHNEYELLAQLYRQLQANYMTSYDYIMAGAFYAGEQNMLRKKHGLLSRLGFPLTLYRIVSFYGESVLLPAFWLFAIVFSFPLLLEIDYWTAFSANLGFLFRNQAGLSMQLEGHNWLNIFASLELAFFYAFVALFLLALRRRFKRRSF